MYFWNSYPFVRLTIVLILGIVCFGHFSTIWNSPITILSVGVLFYSILGFISRKYSYYKLRHLNGILALIIIFFLGGYFTKVKYHSHSNFHYKNLDAKIRGFTGVITSPVNERTNHLRYDFELEQIVTIEDSILQTNGKIHLYVRKDSITIPFEYGDRLNVYSRQFYSISEPNNPGEFNYKLYLKRQNIYSHAFVKEDEIQVAEHTQPNHFLKWAYTLRDAANHTIDKNIPQPRENGIAKALLLGIKDHLDNDVKKAYSSAGAMHVLAVSGLHVGILFLIVKLIFGRLRESGRWGKYAFGAISVSIIWLYAAVTGLSPSVLRAATMFSLIGISQASAREGNIYNTLGLAAFILLSFDPYLTYSVGFQLSFAAVIGIVYLQPKFYRLLNFRLWLPDKAWAITCVSLAAQLATFPLSAFYFHQFPTYFLVSNLIVIPASFLMLTGGIFMLVADPVCSSIGEWTGFVLQQFMWLINELISYVHILPKSLIEWIYMDQFGLFLTYCIVFTLIAGLHYKAFKTLIISAIFGLVFLFWTLLSNEIQSRSNELIFYEISGKTAIDYIHGHSATLYVNSYTPDELELLAFQINPTRLSLHLRPISESIFTFENAGFTMKNVIHQGAIANQKIIIFDSTTFHLGFKDVIETDYIIINNQAVKSLKWLQDNFNFGTIIISTRNSMSYSRKMKKQAEELDLSLHSMKEDGALRISLKEDIKKERTIQPAPFTTNPD